VDPRDVLSELGVTSILSCSEVSGGRDSSVWRVETLSGSTYALRLLPRHRHQQYVGEQFVIDLASRRGIPVPNVRAVRQSGEWSAMLMDWAPGCTLLQELSERPVNVYRLGEKFGSVHASIHKVSLPDPLPDNASAWLLPKTDEEANLLRRIEDAGVGKSVLLHLDFHPLNVMTDGENIIAVLDWANAAVGDPRFDIARTLSILQLEGTHPGIAPKRVRAVIENFEKNWLQGYTEARGAIGSLALFNAWAGLRLLREARGNKGEADCIRIRNWVDDWLKQAV